MFACCMQVVYFLLSIFVDFYHSTSADVQQLPLHLGILGAMYFRDCRLMMCTTGLHGGVCHRTSIPHKSGNKMKEKKKNIQYYTIIARLTSQQRLKLIFNYILDLKLKNLFKYTYY